jgi:Ca2+-binding RTX toxin-like protein
MSRYLNRSLTISPADLAAPSLGPIGTLPPGVGVFDLIEGDNGDNFLGGTENADTIKGYGGNDQMWGGGGQDTMLGGDGNDFIYGGTDFDTLNGGSGDDTIQGIEFGVVLTTSGPCDLIDGGGGIDTLNVNYAGFVNSTTHEPVSVTISMATGAGQVAVDGFQGENFSQMERLNFIGAEGNDNATGGALSDTLDGRGGNDVLRGAGGDDVVKDSWGTVDANGGSGNDTFELNGNAFGHTFGEMQINADSGVFMAGGVSVGTISNFENLTVFTGHGNDNITGFVNGVNTINAGFGRTGNKTFTGGDLNDALTGGDGNDTLYGGLGNDNLSGSVYGGDLLYGGNGNDSLGVNEGDTAYGGGGDDLTFAGADGGSIEGGGGDDIVLLFESTSVNGPDSYIGGGNYDILRLFYDDGVTVDLTGMTIDVEELQFVDSGQPCDFTVMFTTAQLASFEVIRLGTENREDDFFKIQLTTNDDLVLPEISQFSELVLADGGQMVDLRNVGTDWAPKVVGGDGNDTVHAVDWAAIPFFEANLGAGNDTFFGQDKEDRVEGGDGNDVLDGKYQDDRLYGGDGRDQIFGGIGNDHVDDLLNGGAGADKLEGGNGEDIYQYRRAGDSTGKVFDTVIGFDFAAADVFDLKGDVTGIDAKVNGGTLSKATINDDLEAAIGNGELDEDHAVLFKVTAGDYDGKTFLIVDLNGDAGYQANKDLVVLLQGPVNLNSLDTADFT